MHEDTKIHIDAADPSKYITKADARDLTRRVAYVLRHRYAIGSRGPGKDVVLLLSSGSPFLAILFYAIAAAGGVFSGASTAYRVGEIARQVKDAEARLLICSPEYQALAVQTAEKCGMTARNVLVLDSNTHKRWTLLSNDGNDLIPAESGRMLDWERLTTQKQLEDTMIALLYSSGTTGLPKGVRLSHQAILSSCICSMDPAVRYQAKHPDFVFDTIAHLPMANIAGIDMYCTNPFYMGGSVYWMKNYDFETFVEYHRRYRPGYQFTVPPIWLRIAKSDWITDHFDGLQVGVTGSAPIGHATAMEVQKKLGKGEATFRQTWGTTETAGVICAQDWNVEDESWSVGDLVPNLRLRVVDDDDNDVPANSSQPGEMLVGGPLLAQGYHNRPDANGETFVDGWYRTGDIGVRNAQNGRVHIVDRKKELIKYKGQQIAPAELEALLTSHASIADAAVVGTWLRDQETEVPRAYVVRKLSTITAREVADFVKASVAPYKQLRGGVIFVDEIPKSASGKILRKELRHAANAESTAKL